MLHPLHYMRCLLPAFYLAVALAVMPSVPAHAVNPEERLSDPALEVRAREISAKLRCLVCQNQSIDDSDAPLARDLRIVVRERLQEGDNNTEVLDYLVARYGEFILLKPRFGWHTMALWVTPVLLLLSGLALVYFTVWGRRTAPAGPKVPLTDAEKRQLEELLREQR